MEQIEQTDAKQMSIRVKCGLAEKEVAFPVPPEMLPWMEQLDLPDDPNDTDPMRFSVEGSRKIQISVALFDIRRKF